MSATWIATSALRGIAIIRYIVPIVAQDCSVMMRPTKKKTCVKGEQHSGKSIEEIGRADRSGHPFSLCRRQTRRGAGVQAPVRQASSN